MNEPQHWADAYAATADTAHACLPPEELLAALAGELDGERAERAVAALAECPRCAAVAQIARDLHEYSARDLHEYSARDLHEHSALDPIEPVTGNSRAMHDVEKRVSGTLPPSRTAHRSRSSSRMLPWAAAALVVLGVGTATLLMREPASPPAVRGDATVVLDPASGSRLHTTPLRLQWKAIGTATAYRVEIYDDRAESLWRSERVAATSLELPADVRAKLARGTYLWRVRAEGSEIEVGPFWFRVEP